MIVRKLLSRAAAKMLLALAGCALASTSWALALGNATVLSSLGQALHAEIEVSIASDAEAQTLQAALANAQTYAAANLEYAPALQNLKFSVQQSGSGKAVIRIDGQDALNEPVVQILLAVRWSTGKMVRALTLFIDPAPAAPSNTASVVGAVPAKAVSPEPIPAVPAHVPTESQELHPAAAAAETHVTPTPAAVVVVVEPSKAPSAEPGRTERRKFVVQKGQTARQIVAQIPAGDYSPEQLMLALLRANPDAFAGQNINRLKAGAELALQPLTDAQTLSQAEAAKEVARQSAAWRKQVLAMTHNRPAEKAADSGAGRSTNKKVGEASAPATPAPGKDELKLGAAKEKDKVDAEKLAAEMQAKEDAARKEELAKNIDALKEASAKAAAAAPAGADAAPAPSPEPPAAAAAAPAPKVAASVPAPALTEPAPLSEMESLIAYLQSLDPLSLAGAGAAVLLLLVLLWYRQRAGGRPGAAPEADNAAAQAGDGFESSPAPGADLGAMPDPMDQALASMQDTMATQAAPQSVLFADSQLKPSDSLDAVAEADVYLAYGRDAQAEEILREALSVTPNKVELHQKLLDIFVLRGDSEAFAQVAQTMSTYLDSQGPQWLRVCEMGALLDSKNPLFHNHASPDSLRSGGQSAPAPMPAPLEFPAGLDLNLAKPLAASAGTPTGTQDFRPSTQIQPLGFEFSSQNLMLAPDGKTPLDTAQPWSNPDMDEGARLLEQKLELAKEFIAVSDIAGARILLNEVIERAQGAQLEQAKQLLAQIG